MWRGLFLGIGLFLLVVGLECMIIDSATINNLADEGSGPSTITLSPPDWVPWTLVPAGLVTMLYSYTLPQKFKGG